MVHPLHAGETAAKRSTQNSTQPAVQLNGSVPTTGPHGQAFQAVLNDAATLTPAQYQTANSSQPPTEGVDTGKLALDLTQIALDIVGIFEPTPFADGTNTLISWGRGDFWGGVMSAAGIIPYVGDLAKLGKLGKWAKTVANAVELAASSPALAKKLEPGLKAIKEAIDNIPNSALDKLPKNARDAILSMKSKLDEFFSAAARRINPPAITINKNVGKTRTINGNQVTIGDTPTVKTQADGRRVATDINGDDVRVRQPRTYDAKTDHPDGSVTYTKDGQSVTYDANGFPEFNSKADVYLEPRHLNSADDADHFRAANEMLGDALRADPSLAGKMGLSEAQVVHLLKNPPSARPPADFTWHHHQDTGRMQLVDAAEHGLLPGAHLGGMRLWGGGRNG